MKRSLVIIEENIQSTVGPLGAKKMAVRTGCVPSTRRALVQGVDLAAFFLRKPAYSYPRKISFQMTLKTNYK